MLDTGYRPRPQFLPLHHRDERFGVVVAHRRAGKTVAAVNDIIHRAVQDQSGTGQYALIQPQYKQVKRNAWAYLKQYTEAIAAAVYEAELKVVLRNGATIYLFGSDNIDALRGMYLDGVVLDEFGDMKAGLWVEVILPTLADRKGWAIISGTPKGKNAFYSMRLRAEEDADWHLLVLKASATGILDDAELQTMRAEMDDDTYRREFECDFHAAVKGAIYAKELQQIEADGRFAKVGYDPMLPVWTAWDLGIGDATSIWWAQPAMDGTRWIDFYQSSGQALDHYVEVVQSRGYAYKGHLLPHDAMAREIGTGRTRVETLQRIGLACKIVPQHRIEDGINAMRMMLRTSWFDRDKTQVGFEHLRLYRYEFDDKLQTLRPSPLHDHHSHAADAARYMAMGLKRGGPTGPRQTRAQDNHTYGR
ncbi:MAG: terminase family protein [Pseudomonadota bacterium]